MKNIKKSTIKIGDKFNCRKCQKEIIITESMLKQGRYWCQKCKNAHIKDWKKRNPDKMSKRDKAYSEVKKALKAGKLIRQNCEKCGNNITEAHHEDYNKPLDVNWLCSSCHIQLHKDRRINKNDFIIINGISVPKKDIQNKVPLTTIRWRAKKGWSIKDAITIGYVYNVQNAKY